jgi:hypothetical protein
MNWSGKVLGTCGRQDGKLKMLPGIATGVDLYVETKYRPKDCDGRELQPGDMVLAGMRYRDPAGWTLERVVVVVAERVNAIDGVVTVQEAFHLSDPKTGEFMEMSEPGLTKYMSPADEAEWRLGTPETRLRYLPEHARKTKK